MPLKYLFGDLKYRTASRLRGYPRVYINAYAYSETDKSAARNWGDDINYWFLKEIVKTPMRLYNESPIAFRRHDENYLVVGSTISLLTKPESIVWGAGVISEQMELPARPKQVLAVRGPLTRDFLQQRGIECPEVYGDPALLLPLYYKPTVKKKYKLGLIHHVSEKPFEIPDAKLISMSQYDKWTDVIDQICECEAIASSSLHGLIVAEAYGIPNVWTESKNLLGGHFKFHDFFRSLGEDREAPVRISATEGNAEQLYIKAKLTNGGGTLQQSLLATCPFELK